MSSEIKTIASFHNGHDVSYCILKDGEPILHNELERFIRVKEPHSDGLPFLVDTYPDLKNIDMFVDSDYEYNRDPSFNKKSKLSYEEVNCKEDWDLIKDKPYVTLGHHQSHAASAFFSSNFDQALIFTFDGGGGSAYYDSTEEKLVFPLFNKDPFTHSSFSVWSGKGNKITHIRTLPSDYLNIGSRWSELTRFLKLCGGHCHYQSYEDWKKNPDPKGWFGHAAGTVMAMATIGKANNDLVKLYKQYIAPIFYGAPTKELQFEFEEYNKPEEKTEKMIFEHNCMLAASLQKATEEILNFIITGFIKEHNSTNICLSGGVALNAVATGKLCSELNGISIHVDPIPGDNGLPFGAALYTWHQILDNPRKKRNGNLMSYLGKSYSNTEIDDSILKYKDKIYVVESSDDELVDLLAKDNIVAVFGGGSESGRRALGNRSILADPSSTNMKDLINEKVKHRQWFRPFAPSILKDEVLNWFNEDIESPYMSFVIKFKEEMKEKVPAVVHFDGSARLQTVTEKDNPWYYNLIAKFKEKTKIPMLLNTSFNDREPIVETPEHAINCFLGTNIDYLYFYEPKLLIRKK